MAKPEFQIYNTMSKQKEIFSPKEEGKVGMYVCGVTTYDLSHIGHARAYVAFDVLYRYLQHLGYEVTYVRNFTDIDDKIILRANKLEEDPLALSNRFCQEFLDDMNDLQCLPVTYEPRVSTHMDQIRDMITQIIDKDCAYVVDGNVYFSVDKFPEYGRLSGRKQEDNRAGERVAVDERKRNHADFALWKAAKPGEPSWESPWGPGRPGWHIECSAMSAHYLSFSFDIHGGGMDLIFPHHENELAQSCAACSETNVKYWMHNGFVNANNEKMSKSLGNFFTIREITKQYHPLALRYFLMSTHYRSAVNYSIEQLEIASESVFYLYQTLRDCEEVLTPFREKNPEGRAPNGKIINITPDSQESINKLRSDFEIKMSDDLHTPDFLNAALQETLRLINSLLNGLKKKKQQQQSMLQSLSELEKEVKVVLNILGLMSSSTYSEVLEQLKVKALKRAGLTEDDVTRLIEERTQARKNKDFSKSDMIREDLTAKGVALMDLGNQTIWRPCVPPPPPPPPGKERPPPPPPGKERPPPPPPGKERPPPPPPGKEQNPQSLPVAPAAQPVAPAAQPVAPAAQPVAPAAQPVAPAAQPLVAPAAQPLVAPAPPVLNDQSPPLALPVTDSTVSPAQPVVDEQHLAQPALTEQDPPLAPPTST